MEAQKTQTHSTELKYRFRIGELFERASTTPYQVAKATGLQHTTMHHWINLDEPPKTLRFLLTMLFGMGYSIEEINCLTLSELVEITLHRESV